tara:strand:+ start:127 stop:408 length:282 start_codon:yes stop_codon:yes gene_type:complete
MCNDPEVSRRFFSLPGMTYTRTSDGKVITGEESRQAGRGFGSVFAKQAPSASEKAALLGGGKSKNVSKATQTARREKAVATEPVVPGKTPVIK